MLFFNDFPMMRSRLILFFIVLHHTCAIPGEVGYHFRPVIKLRNMRDVILKIFPFGEPQEQTDALANSVVENYLCPAENDQDVRNIEEASKRNYRLKYCLFRQNFQKNESKVCKKEVRFVFHKLIEKGSDDSCGFTSDQTMHAFSFYDCGGLDALEYFRDKNFQKSPQSYKFPGFLYYPYRICYDTVEKIAIRTIHHIQTPQLFQNSYFQNQEALPANAISVNPYFMDPDLFLIIKTRYELEQQKDESKPDTYIMVPQPLVPPDHYALPIIKLATQHYINMAPLWKKLVPLVTAIDQGIKQTQIALESKSPKSYNDIIIHSSAALLEEDTKSELWFNLLLFRRNIWYKFVYEENRHAAVLIIIHNTPENQPTSKTGCLVGENQDCDFEKWTKDKNLRKRISSDDKKYAYCCKVMKSDMKEIYNIDFEIDYYLNIETLIAKKKSS